MLKKFTNFCVKLVDKYLPDPFLFAIILTFVVYVAAIVFTHQTPLEILKAWGNFSDGFWNLLKFSMQTGCIVVFGSTLAKTQIFNKLVNRIVKYATNNKRAIVLTVTFSAIFSWLNYGLGLIAGALLAKAIAKKLKTIDYRLLIASAYSGYIIWHQGLSGSIPLTISTGFDIAGKTIKSDITSTIFHPVNIITAIVCIGTMCIINIAMLPNEKDAVIVDSSVLGEEYRPKKYKIKTPADRIEHSKILWLLTCLLGWAYIFYYFGNYIAEGKSILNGLGRDSVNMILLFLGILLHGNLKNYLDALKDSVSSIVGVILQYPFYAGIMAIMTCTNAEGISLASLISNFFVPSGGGQWSVQAPIVMNAAEYLKVPTNIAAMAIAWGDQWTNMIQPFWALPALAVANLKAKDIMGFMCIITIASGIVFAIGIYLWAKLYS
ncbi:MAG: TIGR00366 family protein [Fusobacterium mortiferum]|nr:TIGR00366 family protein [Fusobacterium mortiferum]